jgi:hypothetical protein
VFGDWLPNHVLQFSRFIFCVEEELFTLFAAFLKIFHKFHLPCALLRFFYLSLQVIWTHRSNPLDLFFVDQISATIPLLKLTGTKVKYLHSLFCYQFFEVENEIWKQVLFYCHFPDQLLAQSDTLLKKCYRLPLNYLEEITTGHSLHNKQKTFNQLFLSPPLI